MKLRPYIDQLPVGSIADQVNRSLDRTPRLVVTAPPGAGKSTLLPLTIMEHLPEGKVLVLEPRRLAARQVAERMAEMWGEPVGRTVGYRMRFESRVSEATRIEVVTEGILTRMLADNATLDHVAAVLFDEFHERSLASDVALAMVRELQSIIRPDLRIVLMSATIDATALCRQLDAPAVECDGRLFDVEIAYGEESDALHCAEQVALAVARAHRKHPEGDILAFLPGQAEIMRCKELLGGSLGDTHICPLYGMLPMQEQHAAIAPSAPGERKVVLATPVAETSLTIEGVRIVVDSGWYRKMAFDARNGLSRMETARISLDMARQRAGRAGRVARGICYRLWTKATELRMAECRQPEVEEADLAPTVMDIAAWGGAGLEQLPWITPPPRANVQQAKQLLAALDALDGKGAITPHGRALSHIPCHPRIAQMIWSAGRNDLKALAADVAALLEERDPLPQEEDADINTRIGWLRENRRKGGKGRWERIASIAAQYRKIAGRGVDEDNGIPDSHDSGRLIASAYPERIAAATGHGSYKLANGRQVALNDKDPLSAHPYLAVASLGNRIYLAAPIEKHVLEGLSTPTPYVGWDRKEGRVTARLERRVGAILLDTQPLHEDVGEERIRVLCETVSKEGLSILNLDDETRREQRRIATVAEWHPELDLPDTATEQLLAHTAEWLPLYAATAWTAAELRKIPMHTVVWNLLSYEQQQAVDRLAPQYIVVPTGSRIRIDYRQGAEAPVVCVRLQECFGLTDTPCVDDGRRPVLMELLSPGFKPVQLTQDLRSFWQTTYFEVRKELRRRYPKHEWPDHPLEAKAVKGVKRKQP